MKKYLSLIIVFLIFSPIIAMAKDDLKESARVSEQWLKLVDAAKYEKSWDEASILLKVKMPKSSWVPYLNNIRKPLGRLKTRDVIDQRTATNPPNMASGHYIVMVYKSNFSHKEGVVELVILRKSDRGVWQVLTYQLS